MKEIKRIFSLIIVFTMIVSCFSTVVMAETSMPFGTFIDEDYGLDDVGSWSLKNAGKGVISSTEVETGNYAATLGVSADYLVRDNAEMLTMQVNGADGIPFEAGKKIIIETRMKQSDPAARYYLKMNTNVLEAQEYNAYHSIFVNDSGTVTPANGVTSSGMGNVYDAGITSSQLATNDWLKIKIELTGDGTAAPTGTITFTDVNNVSITRSVKAAVADTSSYIDALRTLEVRGRSSSTNQIYVDYLKVYTEKVTTKITGITASEKIAPTDAMEVAFEASTLPANLENYVSVYDGATKLTDITKSYDSETGTVSITSDDFAHGKTYTVKIDTDALYEASYILETGVNAEYAVKVSKYLVDEDYGLDNYGLWKLKNSGVGVISSTEVESGNYAATLGVSADYLVKADAEMLTMQVNGADGIPFEAGKKIIIETRMKQSDPAARYYLKMNTNVLENQEYNAYHSIFVNDSGTVTPANGVTSSGMGNVYDGGITSSQLATNDWLKIKIELTGDGTAAPTGTITFTDVNNVSITSNVKVAVADTSSYVNALRTLEVRGRGSSTNQIFVDYLKVYIEKVTNKIAGITVSEKIKSTEAIEVAFDAAILPADLEEYISVYDGSTKVTDVTKVYDAETGKVAITSGAFANGKTYTVKLDAVALEEASYVLESGVACEYSVKVSDAFVDEDYAAGDYGSWTLKNAGKGVISSTEVESGNYAATLGVSGDYLVKANAEMLTMQVNGADGIPFEAGKKIVIETRMKQSDPAARYYLKMNTNVLENQEYNAYHTIFVNDNGTVTPANGVNASGMGNVYDAGITSTQLATNDWLKIKIELTGDGTAAPTGTITFTDVNNVSITSNVKVAVADTSSYVNALRTLEVRGRSSSTNQIFVDYLKVYTEKATNKIAGITVSEKIRSTEAIEVAFDAAILPADLEEYISVYDGSTKVTDVTKVYDAETGKVAITSGTFKDGKTYTVKLDTVALEEASYVLETGVASEYPVKVSSAFVDEDYSAENYGSWKLKNAGKGVISSTEVETGNYAATLGVSADYLVRDNAEMLTMQVNGADGIPFEAGKKIIIETRMKQSDPAARYYLKMNTNVLEAQEYNAYHSIFVNDNGTVIPANGLTSNGQGNVSGGGITSSQLATNDWLKVRIELIGDGTAAPTGTITFTDVNNVSITSNVKVAVADGSSYVNALRTLEVRGRGSSTNQIFVDYLKVTQVDYKGTIDTLDFDGKKIDTKGNMYIWGDADELAVIKDNVKLYNASGAEVAATVSVSGNKLTVNPDATLAAGNYTLKIDTTYGDVVNYVLNANEMAVTVVDYTEYAQSFEASADEWALNIPSQIADSTVASKEIVTENGNSFLRLNVTKHIATPDRGVGLSYNMGENGFVFDSEGYTVIESKIRSTATARKLFKFNTNYSSTSFGYNINTFFGIDWRAGKISHGHLRWNGNATAIQQGAPTDVANYTSNKWYTLKNVYDNVNRKVYSYVYNENDNLIGKAITDLNEPYEKHPTAEAEEGEEETKYVGYWYNFASTAATDREQLRYISELAWVLRYDEAIDLTTAETLDIDDVKIYNTDVFEDEEIEEDIEDGYTLSLVEVGGSAVEEVKAGTEYVPTVNVVSKSGNVKFTLIGVLYKNDVVDKIVAKDFDVISGQYTTDENIVIPDDDGQYKVKLFVWDSIGGMKPLVNVKEIFGEGQ